MADFPQDVYLARGVDKVGEPRVCTRKRVGWDSVGSVVTEASNETLDFDERALETVAREFELGDVYEVAYLPDGLMNRNWRVLAERGMFAVKLLRDVSPETARRSADVLGALAAAGLPVCPPLRTRTGGALLQVGKRHFLVSAWADGAHVEGTELPLDQLEEFGALVAEVHRALADHDRVPLPVASVRPHAKVTSPEKAVEKADRLLEVVAGLPVMGEFDAVARELLEERKALIDKHRADVPAVGPAPGPFGWTHGDLQYRNVLWADGRVNAVLDWDRIAVKPLAEEVARTAQVQLGGEYGRLDLTRVAAFVTGYRSVIRLSRAVLADAVERLWWKRLSDYWVFEFHYDRGDHGPDSLLVPSERLVAWWCGHRSEVAEAFAAGS